MTDIAPDLQELLPKVSHEEPDDRPIGYLWVYDPQEAKVYIENEEGPTPAEYPTHQEMAQHVTHPDRMEGYAFSIVGGWRIMDDQFHPVDDPYIVRKVRQALRHEHAPPPLPKIRYHGDPMH